MSFEAKGIAFPGSFGSMLVPRYEGRLELTWTNKHQRLLAHDDGSYEWVPPSDYRVAEVRLLHDAGAVGPVHADSDRAMDNLLIRGDALNALTSLIELPEFAREYVGKVKLAYLDPPFNTQQSFLQYDDALEHSVWLTMMRDRLAQIKALLSPDGSVWVHCDDSEQAYLKVMMDELFGRENFIGVVIWEKSDSPRMDARTFSVRHDYLLVYGKSEGVIINRLPYEIGKSSHYNRTDDSGRKYYLKPLRAMAGKESTREARPNLWFALTAPDGRETWPRLPDGSDGRWRWSKARVDREFDRIEWVQGTSGWVPYYRIYAELNPTRPPETIWQHAEVGSNRTSKAEIRHLFPDTSPFSTPKPEALLGRVIEIATAPGDVVLDCFLGSGTTAAVAHKMGQRWIGVESEEETLATYAIPRLRKVVSGEDPGGITEDVGWEGGGSFRILEVAPSMFSEVDGQVYLSPWVTDGRLAEATAAQLNYEYQPDPPFCGVKGRSRLVVVDGLVNEAVAHVLVRGLDAAERLMVCGTAIDPVVESVLRTLRPGSAARKIPQSILADYHRSARWNPIWSDSQSDRRQTASLVEAAVS